MKYLVVNVIEPLLFLQRVDQLLFMYDSLPILGVAYSRHIVQIYSYNVGDDVRQHLEVYNT